MWIHSLASNREQNINSFIKVTQPQRNIKLKSPKSIPGTSVINISVEQIQREVAIYVHVMFLFGLFFQGYSKRSGKFLLSLQNALLHEAACLLDYSTEKTRNLDEGKNQIDNL